ncbi:MAG TPA: HAD-IIIC family phosphatase [Methylocystis sp.]|nr:HAD-IIIC family phosphatase [Methylocystis sp.]
MTGTNDPFAELVKTARSVSNLPSLFNLSGAVASFAAAGKSSNIPMQRVAIVGSLTMDFVASAVNCVVLRNGFLPETYLAPFASFLPELITPTSGLYAFHPDCVVLAPDFREYVITTDIGEDDAQIRKALDQRVAQIAGLWKRLHAAQPCKIVQHLFYAPPERLCGVAERRWPGARDNQIRYLNDKLVEAGAGLVGFVEIDRLAEQVGTGAFGAERAYNNGRQPFDARNAVAYLPYFEAAWRLAFAKARKVLALDLDNTLWGGVIGDDGADGIRLGVGSPEGEAFAEWQAHIKKLARRGIVLAVCSKNDPEIAKTGLRHPAAILGEGDFAAIECSWDDKALGLRKIARALNLGLDSFVFADDNPAECGLIQKELPEVGVCNVGADPALFISKFEAGCWFGAEAYTAEDLKRGEQYRARQQALALESEAADLPGYLKSLEMKGKIGPFAVSDVERLAQMESKTNQFNLTTRRYSAPQIQEMLGKPDVISLAFRLEDKFGDHGLVSSLVAFHQGDDVVIDNWLMSCRVFSRSAEQGIFNHLVDVAKARGARRLVGKYTPTAKNGVVAELYPNLGFTPAGEEGVWRVALKGCTKQPCYIEMIAC